MCCRQVCCRPPCHPPSLSLYEQPPMSNYCNHNQRANQEQGLQMKTAKWPAAFENDRLNHSAQCDGGGGRRHRHAPSPSASRLSRAGNLSARLEWANTELAAVSWARWRVLTIDRPAQEGGRTGHRWRPRSQWTDGRRGAARGSPHAATLSSSTSIYQSASHLTLGVTHAVNN